MRDVVERPEATQTFQERVPSAGLSAYVSCIWIQHVAADSPPYPHRTTPTGSAVLTWPGGGTPQVVGPRTGPTEDELAPGTAVAGIRLRPGAVSALFGMSAADLVDRVVPLDDVWPDARWLGEQLVEAASQAGPRPVTGMQAAAAVLEARLRTELTARAALDPIAAQTVRRLIAPASTVTAVATALDISQRQLRRRCETAIGLPPKALHRMLRFQRYLALARAQHDVHPNLGMLAAQAGFADQAHLTRECQRLAGRSPRMALREAQQYCDGNHDHTASDATFLRRTGATT